MNKLFPFLFMIFPIIQLYSQSEQMQPFFDYYINSNFENALFFLNQQIQNDPENPQLHLYLGNTYIRIRKYQNGINEYQKALHKNLNDASIYFNMGQAYENQKMTAKAIAAYQQSILADSTYLQSHLELAMLYFDQTRYDQSLQLSKKILALDSLNIQAYSLIGNNFMKKTRYDSAIVFFQKALKLDSLSFPISLDFAIALSKAKLYDQAILLLENLIAKNAHSDISRFYLAQAYTQTNQFTEAVRQYEYCAELKGKYRLEALRRLAQLLNHLEFYPQCITITSEILDEEPDDFAAHYYRAMAMSETGEYLNAEKEFEIAIGLSGIDYLINIYLSQGLNFHYQKKYPKAIQSYKKLLALDSHYGLAYYNLAITYDEYYKDKKIAIDYYQKFLENRPQRTMDFPFFEKARNRMSDLKEHIFFDKGSK